MFLRTEALLPGRSAFGHDLSVESSMKGANLGDRRGGASEITPLIVDRAFFICFALVGLALPTFVDSASVINIWWTFGSAYAFISLIKCRKVLLPLAKASLPFLLLLLIIAASVLWSDDPSTTARRALALLGSGVLSFWVVIRLGLKTFINTLAITLIVAAAISLVFILFVPSIGIMPSGEWQGVFDRKNTLGQIMLLGLITVFCSLPGSSVDKTIKISMCAFLTIILIGARSGTSTFITVLLAITFPILYWSREKLAGKPALLFVLGLFATTVLALMSTVGEDMVLNALGKDETLTTRTDVWQYVNDGIQERPALGHGYKVFWLSHGGAINDTSRNSVTWATQAHNGYLETELDIGYVGLCAVCFFLLIGMKRSVLFFWQSKSLISAWPLLVILAFIVLNFAEATISKYYDVGWIVFGAAFLFATDAGLGRQNNDFA